MAKLAVTVNGKTAEVDLQSKPVWVVGRKPGLDLTVPVKEASREHCRLGKLKDGRWAVQDLGSTNGTWLNDERIDKVRPLAHEDTVKIGPDCTLVFLDAKDAPAPEPPRPPEKPEEKPEKKPKKKHEGPIVLKSRRDKLKEKREAEIKAKREKAKQAALAKLAEREVEETAAEEEPKGTFDIDSEETLVKVTKDKERFDRLLAAEDQQVVFGNYELLKRLSEGGMGVVFRARHRAKEFEVALKVLRTEMVDENNIARFKQEAWAISAFDHRNIVKVRDLAKHGGMYYIAMDFIKGEDLLAVGFQRTLTYWQVMEIIDKMADVLRLVHARNIWHRDIKPQNILLDRTGEVKLIDFGIATVEREKDAATETAEGLIMGTPAFLSPEQAARGKMGEIDGRADLYSLGAVMYYLLTGRRPFTGRSPLEILKKNMTVPPPHPHTVDELIPPGLVKICMKLLEKHPDDRIQTASGLQEALAEWRKSRDGRHELEMHRKIMKLRERKRKLVAQKKKAGQ